MTTVTVTGYLTDGMNYIGGEGSGWELQTDHAGNIELDVDKVVPQAMKFRHREVTVTGYFTTREYIERAPAEVLVAEEIRLAPSQKN